jgi:hypothetical protein
LGLLGVGLGALSILAAVAGTASIYYGLMFFRCNRSSGTRLPGSGKAVAGIVLSLIGLLGFVLAIVGRLTR